MRADLAGIVLTGSPAPLDDIGEFYVPRRTVLDKMLVDEAARAGAELREGFLVTEIVGNGDSVTVVAARAALRR